MKKTVLILIILGIFIAITLFYAFTKIDNPFSIYSTRIDQAKANNLSTLYLAIDEYNRKNSKLPNSLQDLKSTTYQGFIADDYEYKKITDGTYELCAVFLTDSQKPTSSEESSSPLTKSFELHKKGRACLTKSVYVMPSYYNTSITPTPTVPPTPTTQPFPTLNSVKKTSVFEDENILSVRSDNLGNAYENSYANFPYGLFSSNTNEWGLISKNQHLDLFIQFKKPVKINSMTFFFTNCEKELCYWWSVTGQNDIPKIPRATTIMAGVNTNSDTLSKAFANSDEVFTALNVTLNRRNDAPGFMFLKKISIEYK